MEPNPDVFLSHNSEDKPSVRAIAKAIEERKLKVWLDEWDLRPGRPWQEEITSAIKNAKAVVVFIGPKGLGKWEKPEIRLAVAEQVGRQIPVIPLLLPGAPDLDDKDLPPLLVENTAVDFRSGLNNRHAMDRLWYGITGENVGRIVVTEPVRPGNYEPPPVINLVDEAIMNLSGILNRFENITYFVGSWVLHSDRDLPPTPDEITRLLLKRLGLIGPDYDQLLPPIDDAASYFALKEGERELEDMVVDSIIERSNTTPSLYLRLADLLWVLKKRPRRRVRHKTPHLIVTTNFDVLIERALLQSGHSFTRIVQHRDAKRIFINEYREVELVQDGTIILPSGNGSSKKVERDNSKQLDEIIETHGNRDITYDFDKDAGGGSNPLHALSLAELTEPILYKFHGSQDIPSSCTISADQYLDYVCQLHERQSIPARIIEIISNSPILFLGCGLLDSDFRLTLYTLLRKPLEIKSNPRYAIQAPYPNEENDIHRRLGPRVREYNRRALAQIGGIILIEEHWETFLEQLIRQVEADNPDRP